MADRLNIGVLVCGPIARAGHFESCTKACNARLYAVCDVAVDLRERMAVIHGAERAYADYDDMLADPALQAVIVATWDAFHVDASIRALRAGKHVLCEKPVATGRPQTERLAQVVRETGLTFQVGHMKRYNIGLQEAKRLVEDGMGEMVALKAWYCDSTHRYAMTDAVQPLVVRSAQARRPADDPRADLRRYCMLAHGSHLVDSARFFAGPIAAVNARLSDRRGMHCWFVDVEFENGALGHLDPTVAVRMDWHEGLTIHGRNGSVTARTCKPWYFRSSDVEIFHEADATTRRPLGADGHFHRRQVEGFADTVLTGAPMTGAGIEDGLASVRAMLAIARSVEEGRPVNLADVGGVL